VYTVYLIELNDGVRRYKIGYTKKSVQQRLKQLQTGAHSELRIVDQYESKWGTKIESVLHKTYFRRKTNGEWFDLTEEEVVSFKSECEKIHSNLELMVRENTWVQQTGRFS